MNIVCSASPKSYSEKKFKKLCQPCIQYISTKVDKWVYNFHATSSKEFLFNIRCKKFNKNGFASNRDKIR